MEKPSKQIYQPTLHLEGKLILIFNEDHLYLFILFIHRFGGPQGLMVCETIVEHVSHALSVKYPQLNSDKSQLCNDIRQINMYTEHNAITPYKQLIGDVHRIRLMWERIHEITNYPQRLKQVNEYNKKHKYQKRGISLIPTKFAISFGVTFLNQATALVNIYSHDGSVYISHAGCEMGQGMCCYEFAML